MSEWCGIRNARHQYLDRQEIDEDSVALVCVCGAQIVLLTGAAAARLDPWK